MLTIRPGAVRSVGAVKKRVLAVLTVLYVAAVLAATLTPAGFPTRVFNALFRGGGTVAVSAGADRRGGRRSSAQVWQRGHQKVSRWINGVGPNFPVRIFVPQRRHGLPALG